MLETDRLLLRPWRVDEAAIQREMWIERDPRVPPHRRIDPDGNPTITDFEEAIGAGLPASGGLLAVERKVEGAPIGYCGLVVGRAVRRLRRLWGWPAAGLLLITRISHECDPTCSIACSVAYRKPKS